MGVGNYPGPWSWGREGRWWCREVAAVELCWWCGSNQILLLSLCVAPTLDAWSCCYTTAETHVEWDLGLSWRGFRKFVEWDWQTVKVASSERQEEEVCSCLTQEPGSWRPWSEAGLGSLLSLLVWKGNWWLWEKRDQGFYLQWLVRDSSLITKLSRLWGWVWYLKTLEGWN